MASLPYLKWNDGLLWPDLISGRLVNRYKRFLTDVVLENGETVTAHCPNSGTMKTCCEPGRKVYLSSHDNPKRKLKYTWEMIDMPTSLVGINTQVPNRLVAESIGSSKIAEFADYDQVDREVSVGNHTRLDLLLSAPGKKQCYVEIKNCTLVSDETALFPDAVTKRGLKHIETMETLLERGYRCVMFYLIQRMDATVFKPADRIDPDYGRALRSAHEKGLEILVYDTVIDLKSIAVNRRIPCDLKLPADKD